MTKLARADNDDIEALVDKSGLRTVLESLAEICGGKAAHLRENWADEIAARAWDRDARKLFALAAKLEN